MAKPSNSFLGWLGRQIGSVKGAIQADVTKKPAEPQTPQVVFHKTTVHETTLPDRPNEILRRTVIDDVVRDPQHKTQQPNDSTRSE